MTAANARTAISAVIHHHNFVLSHCPLANVIEHPLLLERQSPPELCKGWGLQNVVQYLNLESFHLDSTPLDNLSLTATVSSFQPGP